MPTLPLLVALALPVAAPEALPAFSKADETRLVAELCGRVEPGSAPREAYTGKPETVSGYMNPEGLWLYEVILSQSYREGAAVRHLLVLGGHAVEDGAIRDVQAQNTELNAALAEWRGGQWVLLAKAPELATVGQYGRNPGVALRDIGASRHAFEVSDSYFHQGAVIQHVSLYELSPAGIEEILSVNLDADDCIDGETNCFTYKGTLEYPATSAAPVYDLKLTLTGTWRNAKGRIVPVPAAPLVLRLQDGGYAPAGASTAGLWTALTSSPW